MFITLFLIIIYAYIIIFKIALKKQLKTTKKMFSENTLFSIFEDRKHKTKQILVVKHAFQFFWF